MPKKFRIRAPCSRGLCYCCRLCRCRASFYVCLFGTTLIDTFVFLKFLFQIREMFAYSEDYPTVVAVVASMKAAIYGFLLAVLWIGCLHQGNFNLCKIAYGAKLLLIFLVFYHAFFNADMVQEQCARWLRNDAHEFARDSSDSNTHRPLTQIFSCNFERVMEDKTKKVTADTI